MQNTVLAHKSSVGQSRGEDETNSDSGDSFFFSQKSLPEAVRSGWRRLPRLGSAWTQEDPAELEDDIFSSSSSDGESRTKRRKRRRRRVLPCRLSFLTERKGQTNGLPRVKVKQLQSYMVGGYFKHVQVLWESYERGVDVAAALPTVDVDGEEISPLSEEEKDEAIEDEDIKVVDRQDFATSIKPKSSKPWCASKKRRNQSPALTGLPGQQQKTEPKVSTSAPELKERPSSAMQTSRDEDPLCGDLRETEAQVTSDVKTGENPVETRKQLSDESRAALQPEGHTTGRDRDPHAEVLHVDEESRSGTAWCRHENGNLPQSDVNDDTLRLKKKKKKKKKGIKGACKGVDKEEEQIQAGREGQHEEELLSPSEDISVKDVPESKPKKKKKKKKPAEEDGRQDDRSVEEASVASRKSEAVRKKKKQNVDADGGGTGPAAEPPTDDVDVRKKQKKKKDLSVTADLSPSPTEQRVGNTDALQETKQSFTKRKKVREKKEPPASNHAVTNTAGTSQKKKKTKMTDISDAAEGDEDPELKMKKKKQKNIRSVSTSEDATAQVDSSASARKQKKKKGSSSFLAADEEGSGAKERCKPSLSATEKPDVSATNFAAKSAENVESSENLEDGVNEKKKKKRSAVQESMERETEFEEPKGTPAVEVKKKRKRKRSDGELTSQTERSLDESHTDVTVPQKKKKKKTIRPAAQSEASTLSIFSSDSQGKKFKKKREKEENKLSPATKPSPKTAELSKTNQTERTETKTSSLSLKRQNNKKKKLFDPSQNFLSNF